MKRSNLPLLALGATLLTPVLAFGQKSAPAANQQKQNVVLVRKLEGAQQVAEFQHDVQVLQNERQQAIEQQAAMEKEKNAAKKKEMKEKLDAMMKKLNADNAAMAKAYGFSLTRNYIFEIQSANVYMAVTPEEAAKLEAEKAKQEKQGKK
ncbi:MAG TPA: hypothetical protein VHE61_21655 [Opitutaceae bacterium]|nr:hypothetical protein [Opitutaceae bacterium]